MSKIKSFTENIQVVHIGNLFRNRDKKRWYLYVWFRPMQQQKWTSFTHLPVLSRGRWINSTEKRNSEADHVISFHSEDALGADVLASFPDLSKTDSIRDLDGKQNSFTYHADSGNIAIKYHIPQLELAKSLFLINSYFCRSCLSTTALQQDFDVTYDGERDYAEIRILQTASFPKKRLEQSAFGQLLTWLFTDEAAMRSYQSIYQHYQKNSWFSNNTEFWRFSFEPPPMQGWKLHVKGRWSADGKDYLVEEIVGIELNVKLPATIVFIDPSLQETGAEQGTTQRLVLPIDNSVPDEELEIDDELAASDLGEVRVVEADSSWLKFSNPAEVTVTRKARKRNSVITAKEGDQNNSTSSSVSTDEPHVGGVLPSVDVGGKQDASDYNHLFANRFIAFNCLVQLLEKKYSCQVLHEETLGLPKVGRSKLQLLRDGSPRVIKAVWLRRHGRELVLLEVDSSDNVKMLSTKVLQGVDRDLWNDEFRRIRRGIMVGSLSWPNGILDRLYGCDRHKGVNHPKGLNNEVIDINIWAERVLGV